MLTKSEIFEMAEQAELGSIPDLEKKFRSWQRFGLVGEAIGKTPRRGGEGLWHPVQAHLFIGVLKHRQADILLTTTANLPVGFWLLGAEGIEVAQVQRAVYYWITRRTLGAKVDPKRGIRPGGERSIRQRGIRAIVHAIASPDADKRARRKLESRILIATDGITSANVPREFVDDYLAVAAPDRASTEDERLAAENLYYSIRLQLIALSVLPQLCVDRSDLREFWAWIRRYAWDALEPGSPEPGPAASLQSPLTAEQTELLSRGLERSCANTLAYAGAGLRILAGGDWSPGLLRPPPLRGIEMSEEWAAPDHLLDLIARQHARWNRELGF